MDEYIYSQSVHKDFHGIMSFLAKFLRESYGKKEMESFFHESAKYIYKPLIKRIKKNGIIELKKHFERIFDMEDGKYKSVYNENSKSSEVIIEVIKCPAIWHMKDNKLEIDNNFCRCTTEIVNKSLAEECGYNFTVRFDQEKGKCIQKFQEVK